MFKIGWAETVEPEPNWRLEEKDVSGSTAKLLIAILNKPNLINFTKPLPANLTIVFYSFNQMNVIFHVSNFYLLFIHDMSEQRFWTFTTALPPIGSSASNSVFFFSSAEVLEVLR